MDNKSLFIEFSNISMEILTMIIDSHFQTDFLNSLSLVSVAMVTKKSELWG